MVLILGQVNTELTATAEHGLVQSRYLLHIVTGNVSLPHVASDCGTCLGRWKYKVVLEVGR